MGRNESISATLRNYSDKQKIMQHERNLPNGIYINEEFPLELKKTGISSDLSGS